MSTYIPKILVLSTRLSIGLFLESHLAFDVGERKNSDLSLESVLSHA